MMDQARPTKIGTQGGREVVTSLHEGLLPLEGGVPQTVHVQIDANQHVAFWVEGGPQYPNGILWKTNGYALMVTFVFVNTDFEIVELLPVTPSFWFSDTHTVAQNHRQACCVQSLPGEYHFNIKFRDTRNGVINALIDPKIVVTPIVNARTSSAMPNGR